MAVGWLSPPLTSTRLVWLHPHTLEARASINLSKPPKKQEKRKNLRISRFNCQYPLSQCSSYSRNKVIFNNPFKERKEGKSIPYLSSVPLSLHCCLPLCSDWKLVTVGGSHLDLLLGFGYSRVSPARRWFQHVELTNLDKACLHLWGSFNFPEFLKFLHFHYIDSDTFCSGWLVIFHFEMIFRLFGVDLHTYNWWMK